MADTQAPVATPPAADQKQKLVEKFRVTVTRIIMPNEQGWLSEGDEVTRKQVDAAGLSFEFLLSNGYLQSIGHFPK